MPPIGLVVEIKGDASQLTSELDKTKGAISGFGGGLGKAAVGVAAVAGVAGVAGAAIIGMTEAAAADRTEQEKLMLAIQNAGAATAESTAQVDAAIAAGQEKAFTDSETRGALESLVLATGDVGAANDLLAASQDIARASGVDLATAADAVAKANAGQATQLSRLMPGLEKGATASDTLANATAAAAGQADIYADSAEGMKAKGSDSFAEIGETIGSVFLPVMDEVLPALLPILKAFGELITALLPALIPLIRLLAGALRIVAGVISTVVGWLAKLVGWIGDAIGAVSDFLGLDLSGFSLPSLPFIGGNAAAAGTRGASTQGAAPAPITINVHGAIDPEGTARAIARVLGQHSIRVGRSSPLATGGGAI